MYFSWVIQTRLTISVFSFFVPRFNIFAGNNRSDRNVLHRRTFAAVSLLYLPWNVAWSHCFVVSAIKFHILQHRCQIYHLIYPLPSFHGQSIWCPMLFQGGLSYSQRQHLFHNGSQKFQFMQLFTGLFAEVKIN